MAYSVSAAYLAACSAPSSEPQYKVLAVLRNVAAQAEGATATASSVYDSNWPASGAIDGDVTHINCGTAASADNAIGLSSWKSGSLATSSTWTNWGDWSGTARQWADVTTTADAHLTIGPDSAQAMYATGFDNLTNTSSLGGQDGWTNIAAWGNLLMSVSAAYAGSHYGLPLTAGATNIYGGYRATSTMFTTQTWFGFRLNIQTWGGASASMVRIDFGNTTSQWFMLDVRGDKSVYLFTATSFRMADAEVDMTSGTWMSFVGSLDRTTPSLTVMKVWRDGRQMMKALVDGTTIDGIRLLTIGTSTAHLSYFDDLWFAKAAPTTTATMNAILDCGTTPSHGLMTLAYTGATYHVRRFMEGGLYGMQNNDTTRSIGNTTTGGILAQTFQLSETASLDFTSVMLLKSGTLVGNVWLEVRPVVAASVSANVLARSRSIPTDDMTTTAKVHEFSWPIPWFPLGTSLSYALVVNHDFGAGGSAGAYVGVRTDASGPGYAGGSVYLQAGANWTAVAEDLCFAMHTGMQTQTAYAASNRDAGQPLGGTTTAMIVTQSFTVPYDKPVRHFTVYGRLVTTTAVIPTGTAWYAELHTDDGTGRDSGTLLTDTAIGVKYDAAYTGWTAGGDSWFTLSLPENMPLVAGVTYHLAIRWGATVSTNNSLVLGADNSAPGYANGQGGQAATTTAWTTTGMDLCFGVLAENRPMVRFDYASRDTTTAGWSAYAKITDDPSQTAAGTVSFTATAARYYNVRAELVRVPASSGEDQPIEPVLHHASLKASGALQSWVELDFG